MFFPVIVMMRWWCCTVFGRCEWPSIKPGCGMMMMMMAMWKDWVLPKILLYIIYNTVLQCDYIYRKLCLFIHIYPSKAQSWRYTSDWLRSPHKCIKWIFLNHIHSKRNAKSWFNSMYVMILMHNKVGSKYYLVFWCEHVGFVSPPKHTNIKC